MLTDRGIKKLKPGARRLEIPDDKVPGLALRITPNGVKTWTLRYRVGGGRAGRLRRLTLGAYARLGLSEARKAASKALRAVDGGVDPAAAKLDARLGETFADLAKDYITKHAKVHKRSWREDERYLNADILPLWRHRKLKELTRRDVRALVEGIAERGAPSAATRCLALIRGMLNWAVGQDWLDANPAARLANPGAERSRERVLNNPEIRLVWAACDGERPAMAALYRLRLLTAQRGGELAQLRWSDIEGDVLTIPSAVAKNKTAHRVPLTTTAIEILNSLPRVDGCDYIFSGRYGNTHLGDAKNACQRIANRVLATLQADDPAIKAFDFRGHDLRRTAATTMAAAGVSHTDIGRVLNHVTPGAAATRIYNRYAYDKEKRLALETLDRVIGGILKNADGGAVVPFSRKGA